MQRDFVRSINPVDSLADYVHSANVNIANQCNAYFNGGSINFYQAGGSCPNTAYPNIAYHENGHWLNVRYGTNNDSTGMGEGNADMWAMYIDDDPIVGHDFAGIGNNVRNGLNTRQFCGDVNLGCYGEEHADGEVWMGAGWKIRRNLKNTYGVAPGGAIANAVFLGWMETYNQQLIQSIIETQWLTLDDDDGVLGNGTPHYAQIDPAFREQGFPGYPLFPVAISSVTKYPDTQNQIGPYNIDETVIAYQNPPLTSVTLAYKFGGGGFTNVAMSNIGGNVYRGQIPGHLAPVAVTYYVTAANIGGQTGISPTTAPAIGYRFDIGAKTVIFSDNFENSLGWVVSNTSLSTGAWERGNPNGTIAQPEDDNPLGSGTQCYFTQNAAVGQSVGTADVDGGPTTLTSPAIDFSSTGAGSIKYAYWFYNDSGDDSLVVQLSNGGVWVTARTYTQGQPAWMYDSVDVGSYVTPNATVQIRFSTADNPNDSITEAAIDDVVAATLSAIPCPLITTYCTAKTNSLGCVPSIGSTGIPTGSGAGPFEIDVTQVLNNKTILLFYGYQQASAPFFGGTRCIAVPLIRTGLSDTGGNATGNDCSGVGAFDFEALILSGVDTSLAPGISPVTQFYYRDPADPFTVGLSNALQFRICP